MRRRSYENDRAMTAATRYVAVRGSGRRTLLSRRNGGQTARDRAVSTAMLPPANADDVDECRGAALQPDAAFRALGPHHAYLLNAEAGTLRKEQELDVERKSIDREMRTERLDGVLAEQLEAALCVHDSWCGEQPDDPVEHPPDRMARQRLADTARAGSFARPHNHRGRAGLARCVQKHRPVLR